MKYVLIYTIVFSALATYGLASDRPAAMSDALLFMFCHWSGCMVASSIWLLKVARETGDRSAQLLQHMRGL